MKMGEGMGVRNEEKGLSQDQVGLFVLLKGRVIILWKYRNVLM